jgi:hypothetical protein
MDDNANQYATDDIVHFSDNTEDEYKKLVEDDIIKTNTSLTATKNNGNINDDDDTNETEENINFDDI